MIAITGCAYVGSAGNSLDEAFARCLSGEIAAEWLELKAGRCTYRAPIIRAADPDPRGKRGLDRSVLLGLQAARDALANAGLKTADAVFAGTSRGPIGRLTRSLREERFPPGDGPAGVVGCLSGAIAASLGIAGAAVTVSASCTSSAAAIVLGAQHLLGGEAGAVLVGGAEAPLQPVALGPLATSGILGSDALPERACRPFDRTRNGTVIGEGAAFLVLESLEGAYARGARVLAILAGWSLGTEPATRVGQEETGEHFSRVIKAALARAGVAPDDLGYVNLHGTGTPLNDRTEAAALARALPGGVPCSSIKAVVGHCMGAASAVESLIALESLRTGELPPTWNCFERDPVAPSGLITAPCRRVGMRTVATLSSGFWGTHAALVFRVAP